MALVQFQLQSDWWHSHSLRTGIQVVLTLRRVTSTVTNDHAASAQAGLRLAEADTVHTGPVTTYGQYGFPSALCHVPGEVRKGS